MKTKLGVLTLMVTVLVALTGCTEEPLEPGHDETNYENEEPLEPRHDALPQVSEDILGLSRRQAERILKANGFIESDEAHAPRNSWHLDTYSLNPQQVYSEVKYYVRGEKNTPERDYDYDEWITVGLRNNTLHAFRSMLFPDTKTKGLNEFRTWSDFAWSTACSNPDLWHAYIYYEWKDPRNASFTIDSVNHYVEGNRAEYEEARAEMTDDIVEVYEYYLRLEKPRAVMLSYQHYKGKLFLNYGAEYTAKAFWGASLDGGDGPGSSTVEPTDPNQGPTESLSHPAAFQGKVVSSDIKPTK